MKEFIASFTIVFLGSLLLVRDLYSLPPPPPPPKFTLNSITPSITQVNSFQSYGPITAKNFVFRSVGTEGESY
ncbi:MAG: hypothetical protein KDD53_10710, partial [Bdellovibrionales bacterium]|nr:hypothetical protein [Bdellovibrionales bacterium]